MPYLIEVTLTNPTVIQLRCCTTILSHNGLVYRLAYSPSVWADVKPKEELP